MSTATRKRTSKKTATKAQSTIVKLNTEALKTTEELIDGTIETGAKFQNLYAKSLKKSEPIITKNINIAFDTVETIVDQYQKSSKRALALFGWDVKEVKKATQKVVSTAKGVAKPATNKASSLVKKATATAKTVTPKAKKQAPATEVVASAKKATSKAATTAKETDTTNLKLITGVGAKMETLLKKEGYPTLESISKATVTDLKKVLDRADARYRLLNPASWVNDAKKALK
ncbi:MAG: putative flap endonuclease-1-like 5' DNA nuclease [Saprospiraceae bacterium]|jgi:predicted flap endonuclease-1-like 5' DNA nuclease